MITETAKVISQEKLAEGIYSMWIDTAVANEAKAGQFVAIYPQNASTLLQRPISICEIEDNAIRIVYRVVGKGTDELSRYSSGDPIRLLGPCGNGFDKDILNSNETALLIGGGIGVPPMLEFGKELKKQGKTFYFVMGYRNSDLFLYDEFVAVAGKENVLIATEDGSVGVKGNVLDAITSAEIRVDKIFSCGPMPMLRALKKYSEEKGIEAYISLEERMACGVGACLGCVCKTTKKDHHSQVNNARVCVEGPVFKAEDVEI